MGNSGDFVIHNLKSVQASELRFPNRYVVDDWADGDQSLVQVNPGKLEQLGIFADDVVKIVGRFKRATHCTIKADEACDPTRIRMSA